MEVKPGNFLKRGIVDHKASKKCHEECDPVRYLQKYDRIERGRKKIKR
jgi:hypothetical protein